MRDLIIILGSAIIVLVFIAGCTSISVKKSDFQEATPSLTIPPTTVTQSTIVTATITQTKYYLVAVTPQRNGNNIVITYQGGPDANLVSKFQYGIKTADHQWYSPKIGEKMTLPGGTSGRNHVVVIGTFTDGSTQTILDTYV